MTPLLFEVFSGTLDVRHASFPIRAFLRTTRFVEATVRGIDLERRVVHLAAQGDRGELAYDQLVLALGARTNRVMIPGSEHAFTFKTLAEAFVLRNHVIERFERADVETDPRRKRQLLTFAIIGGGLSSGCLLFDPPQPISPERLRAGHLLPQPHWSTHARHAPSKPVRCLRTYPLVFYEGASRLPRRPVRRRLVPRLDPVAPPA
jgi:hypothetical protein